MELVFDILSAREPLPEASRRKVFDRRGGVIGRHSECDWVIPDTTNRLSKRHAEISYRNGTFWLTDTSTNGTWVGKNASRLLRGTSTMVGHEAMFDLSGVVIRAQLLDAQDAFDVSAGWGHIPGQAHSGFDPLNAFEKEQPGCADIGFLLAPAAQTEDARQYADHVRIDVQNLQVPQLIEAQPESAPEAERMEPEHQSADFWGHFAAALGVDLADLDHESRELLAVNSACLLWQCVDGLQKSLRMRSDLKNELRLAQTSLQGLHKMPLQCTADPGEALNMLLKSDAPGHLPAGQVVERAFRDLQAHQVAMLAASRAAIRGTLEHFSPQRLARRLERDYKPLFATAGSHWRAYGRYHQTLCESDDWTERLLARDFVQAYEEQIRLISTFQTGQQG